MKKLFFAIIAPTACFALQERPWYGDMCEFHFRPQYTYEFFRKIDRALPQLTKNQYNNVLQFDLDFTFPDTWNWEMELEFADTTPVSWGYRSFALQIRKLWLDDVACDPISLSTGLVYRDAGGRMRKAPITPYHSRANFEFHTSIGKEWSSGPYWYFRSYAVGAIGQGTSGSPWLRGDLFFWLNIHDCHQFRIYGKSYWGLGSKTTVPTHPFPGWSEIGHQSIDLGASYRYTFGVWFDLQFDYLYRVHARSFPEKVNTFLFTLNYPFCPL